MTVSKPKTGAKAPDRIYEIDCPVTVETQRGPNRKGQEPGRLRQIGIEARTAASPGH